MSDYQHHRLRTFVARLATLLDSQPDEATLLRQGSGWLAELIRHDDWLDEAFTQPRPAALPAVPAARRFAATLFGGQLRLGAGPTHAGARPPRLGPDRHAARRRVFAAVRLHHRWPARFTARGRAASLGARRSGSSVTPHRRHPPGQQRLRRPAVHQHPRLRCQHRRGSACCLQCRRRRETLHLRLQQPLVAQYLGPVENNHDLHNRFYPSFRPGYRRNC